MRNPSNDNVTNDSANERGRDDYDNVRELSFDDDARVPPRTGDLRVAPGAPDPEISARRVREAGMTGGEIGNGVTDDDLSPETLLDEEQALDRPNDKRVRVVNADEAGAGYGLDEAELAQRDDRAPDGSSHTGGDVR